MSDPERETRDTQAAGKEAPGGWTGSCLCGAVRYRIRGAEWLGAMEHCHCTDCRKAHAAAFATFVDVVRDGFTWSSGEERLRSHQVATGAVRRFCDRCGSLLAWEHARSPGSICITAATFDTNPPPLTGRHIFVRSRVPWFECRDGLPQYETNDPHTQSDPGRRAVGTPGARPIRFFFDYISPNAWLAWARLRGFAARAGRGVEPVPVLFAGLLDASGRPGPAEVPAMWRWMVRNVLRKGALYGVPVNPPHSHPFNPLLALRVSSLPMSDAQREEVVESLFRAVWVDGVDLSDRSEVARRVSAAGMDGDRAVRDAGERQVKDLLRRRTEEAVAAGVFGVPTMLVDGELFWGNDDLEFMERFLGGRDPIVPEDASPWQRVPSSARRR